MRFLVKGQCMINRWRRNLTPHPFSVTKRDQTLRVNQWGDRLMEESVWDGAGRCVISLEDPGVPSIHHSSDTRRTPGINCPNSQSLNLKREAEEDPRKTPQVRITPSWRHLALYYSRRTKYIPKSRWAGGLEQLLQQLQQHTYHISKILTLCRSWKAPLQLLSFELV